MISLLDIEKLTQMTQFAFTAWSELSPQCSCSEHCNDPNKPSKPCARNEAWNRYVRVREELREKYKELRAAEASKFHHS